MMGRMMAVPGNDHFPAILVRTPGPAREVDAMIPDRPAVATDSSRTGSSARLEKVSREGIGLRWRLLVVAAVCGLIGGLALPIDLPAATWLREKPLPKEFVRLCDFSEIFAHGIGVASLLAALFVLDPSLRAGRSAGSSSVSLAPTLSTAVGWWRRIVGSGFGRIVAATVTGGLVVDVLKVSITRVRPRAADLERATSALDTFGTGLLANPVGSASDLMSFPSGHCAIVAGFAAALSWKYPHGRPVFVTFAALAIVQRLVSAAHYPSDAACGVALGLAGAALWLGGAPAEKS
jgi:membrane-associated phospholipid phosphatase